MMRIKGTALCSDVKDTQTVTYIILMVQAEELIL